MAGIHGAENQRGDSSKEKNRDEHPFLKLIQYRTLCSIEESFKLVNLLYNFIRMQYNIV